ncbi:MAG: HAD family hydrolase [Chloroflexi bacterium]|jgi:HAD superfamily hydrolase (TIGR01509 family)|nr:HAD family hydrolase [Chloroflexota bacterium]
MRIKGFIFDFDGTVLETESPEYDVWQEIYQEYGGRLTMDDWSQAVGGPPEMFDVVGHLENQVGHTLDREAIMARRHRRIMEITRDQDALPGVRDYLETAKRLGIKLCIASCSDRPWIVEHLDRLGLTSTFEHILSMEDVQRLKPDPELYLLALQRMGLEASEVVVFEDSHNGVAAAKCAGIYVVNVVNSITRHRNGKEADLVVDSLAEIPPLQLLEQLEHPGS